MLTDTSAHPTPHAEPAPGRRRGPSPAAPAALALALAFMAALYGTPGPASGAPDPAGADEEAAAPLRDRVLLGAYVPDRTVGRSELARLESCIGSKLDIASSYQAWDYVFGSEDDRLRSTDGARRVLYAWEPYGLRFSDIADGSQDDQLARVADSMRAYPFDIYVRPWPEMTGRWSSWQPTPGGDRPEGGTPAEFVAAWRHLVGFFRSRGVTNLRFVFNPDASVLAGNTPVDILWPGADYVDVIGLDGYNWGVDRDDPEWLEFDEIFAPMYEAVTALDPDVPIWIAETGAPGPADGAGSALRAGWIERMLTSNRFPRLEALIWFEARKERDWRLTASAASLDTVRDQLAQRPDVAARVLDDGGTRTSC